MVARLLFWFGLVLAPLPAQAQSLVADLSRHLIEITAGFSGAEVVLFGAVDGPGDVVVVVRGPDGQAVVRRKARIGGIWVNRDSMTFERAPSFYRLAASRPLEEFAPRALRGLHQLGTDTLRLETLGTPIAGQEPQFREALIRNKTRLGLYAPAVAPVTFVGERLFRTRLSFPTNVPVGTYLVRVLLVRDGQVVSAQTTPLVVNRAGLEAEIYEFAHKHSAVYGLVAILVALVAGWLGHMAFRRS